MKKNKQKNNIKGRTKKNRNKLLIVGIISFMTILGGTLAYFTTSTNIINYFQAAKYQTKIEKEFISPDNWTPGTTTNNTIKVTNNGTIDMAIRANYTEKWVNAKGEEISLKDENNNIAAIINFNPEWVKDSDGYYYYGSKTNKTRLSSGEISSSFIESVTFNENIKATIKRTETNDNKTITYESTGDGFDGARYILTVSINTIQYDQANNIWN